MGAALLFLLLLRTPAADGAPHRFDVTAFGARGDNATDNTASFRAAVAAAAQAAPAVVLVPPAPGAYLTGAFNLSSDTTLLVQGTVRGISNRSQYPVVAPLPSYGSSRDVGHARYQALIMTEPGAARVKILGTGAIDGGGAFWWDLYARKALEHGRPRLIELYNASDVEVGQLTLRDSGFWTLHPVYSNRVWLHDLRISAPADSPNTDGIDPDSSTDVLIERCWISCGDDHIAIKSGLDAAGRAVNLPSRNITVRGNRHLAGRGISIGSEVSGGVSDVWIEDVVHAGPSEHGLHIKTAYSRGGYVTGVTYRNITLGKVVGDSFISLTTSYGGGGGGADTLTRITDIRYENVRTGAGAIAKEGAGSWKCFEKRPCENVVFVDVVLSGAQAQAWTCKHVGNASVSNVSPSGLSQCFGD